MTEVLQHVVNAASLGSLYALFALGIGLIFGIARIINFAHGELIMVGGYVLLFMAGVPWPIAILATLGAAMVLALGMERLAFRPVRTASPTTLLIVSFALAVLIQNVVILIAGTRAKSLDFAPALTTSIDLGVVRTPRLDLVTIAVTALLLVGLALFLRRSRLGVHLRAAAEDFEMARLLGVRTNRVMATAFALSGLLAGTASVLLVIQTGTLTPNLGLQPVLIAFIATVIGGLGSLTGAAAGGFVLGALTVVLQVVLPDSLVPYRDALLFSAIIAMLLVRPGGLIPGTAVERV